MSMVTCLAWAIACLIAALICWRGVRMPKRPALAALACVCMAILATSAWNALQLVNIAMQAHAMGIRDELKIPGSVWSLASIGVVIKFAPLWLLGKS